jgi:hypothetical protein
MRWPPKKKMNTRTTWLDKKMRIVPSFNQHRAQKKHLSVSLSHMLYGFPVVPVKLSLIAESHSALEAQHSAFEAE